MEYQVTKINDDTYMIMNHDGDTFYLLIGKDKACVIDTGMAQENIMPLLNTLTEKEKLLIITHAHVDHLYHLDEFKEAYMSHDELALLDLPIDVVFKDKHMDLTKTHDLKDDDEIDLGERILQIKKVPGHTYGSLVVLDEKDGLLFTGDALGSGTGVWLELPGVTTIAVYHESLKALDEWLPNVPLTFYGGHYHQRYENPLKADHPVTRQTLKDMIVLTEGIIDNTIVGTLRDQKSPFVDEMGLYARYNEAEILYLPSKIK